MHEAFLSHSFPMYPVPKGGEAYNPPPKGTEARCGFRVPEECNTRAHDPITDETCPECVRHELLSIHAKERALATLQTRSMFDA